MGKSHALPFVDSLTVYSAPLQLIIADVWGPAFKSSRNGFCYYVSFFMCILVIPWYTF